MNKKNTILLLSGPNLNLLGIRKPEIYGKLTLQEIVNELEIYAKSKGINLVHIQTNYEGKIIDVLHSTIKNPYYMGCIINPGALTHYSLAIRDAIEAIPMVCIEVHLTDIENREDFRKTSVISEVCHSQIKGLGIDGYKQAINMLIQINEK